MTITTQRAEIESVFSGFEASSSGLNAVTLTTFERARELDEARRKRLSDGEQPGVLDGIPLAVKDIIDIAGYLTSMGSRVRVGPDPRTTAPAVAALEQVGALPVAKANLTEFAYGILGDESAFGRCVNPLNSALCTGGSSSGSAVLVASGAVPLALGTDTAGSVRVPAACAGVLGFKPTRQLISAEGIFPLSPSFDSVGLFTRDLDLMRRAFEALAEGAPGPAAATRQATGQGTPEVDCTLLAGEGVPAEVRNAVTAAFGPADEAPEHEDFRELLRRSLELYDLIRRYEAYQIHLPYLAAQQESYQPGVLGKILSGRNVAAADYQQALREVEAVRIRAVGLYSGNRLLATPMLPRGTVPWSDLGPESAAEFMRYAAPFNVLGWPAISVPMPVADAHGVPVSVQIAGPPGADNEVLRAADVLLRGLQY